MNDRIQTSSLAILVVRPWTWTWFFCLTRTLAKCLRLTNSRSFRSLSRCFLACCNRLSLISEQRVVWVWGEIENRWQEKGRNWLLRFHRFEFHYTIIILFPTTRTTPIEIFFDMMPTESTDLMVIRKGKKRRQGRGENQTEKKKMMLWDSSRRGGTNSITTGTRSEVEIWDIKLFHTKRTKVIFLNDEWSWMEV